MQVLIVELELAWYLAHQGTKKIIHSMIEVLFEVVIVLFHIHQIEAIFVLAGQQVSEFEWDLEPGTDVLSRLSCYGIYKPHIIVHTLSVDDHERKWYCTVCIAQCSGTASGCPVIEPCFDNKLAGRVGWYALRGSPHLY